MHGRYKMVLCYLAGDMLEPAPHAPQSGSAQRSVQGIPVSPCLLLRCCFLVAVKGLRFSISLPSFLVFCLLCRSLVLFSPCCPLLSGSRLSAVRPRSALTRVGTDFLTCAASHSTWICISEESQEGNQGVHPVFVCSA